jgi:hypothetical protein
MDNSEQKLRARLARARGGHKRVLEAQLAKLTGGAEEAPEKPKPKRKKRAKKATKKD